MSRIASDQEIATANDYETEILAVNIIQDSREVACIVDRLRWYDHDVLWFMPSAKNPS